MICTLQYVCRRVCVLDAASLSSAMLDIPTWQSVPLEARRPWPQEVTRPERVHVCWAACSERLAVWHMHTFHFFDAVCGSLLASIDCLPIPDPRDIPPFVPATVSLHVSPQLPQPVPCPPSGAGFRLTFCNFSNPHCAGMLCLSDGTSPVPPALCCFQVGTPHGACASASSTHGTMPAWAEAFAPSQCMPDGGCCETWAVDVASMQACLVKLESVGTIMSGLHAGNPGVHDDGDELSQNAAGRHGLLHSEQGSFPAAPCLADRAGGVHSGEGNQALIQAGPDGDIAAEVQAMLASVAQARLDSAADVPRRLGSHHVFGLVPFTFSSPLEQLEEHILNDLVANRLSRPDWQQMIDDHNAFVAKHCITFALSPCGRWLAQARLSGDVRSMKDTYFSVVYMPHSGFADLSRVDIFDARAGLDSPCMSVEVVMPVTCMAWNQACTELVVVSMLRCRRQYDLDVRLAVARVRFMKTACQDISRHVPVRFVWESHDHQKLS